MRQKILKHTNIFRKNPKFVIGATAGLLFLISVLFFYPGLMSYDSINQLSQALGKRELTDWHPAISAIMWRIGIRTTGLVGIMLIFQQIMYWLSIGLLSYWVYSRTKSKAFVLSIFILSLSPFLFILTGTIWKDVQFALSLLLASVLALYLLDQKEGSKKRWIFTLISVCIVYAMLVRHGVWGATIPLAVFTAYIMFKKLWKSILFTIILIILSMIIASLIGEIFHVRKINVQAAIMFDDIAELATAQDISKAGISKETKLYLNDLRTGCTKNYPQSNRLFICIKDDAEQRFISIVDKDYDSIRNLWVSSILSHPINYVKFRVLLFGRLLNPAAVTTGLEVKNLETDMKVDAIKLQPPSERSIQLVIGMEKTNITDFGFFYKPYFWILGGLLLIIAPLYCKMRQSKYILTAYIVSISGILYGLSYLFFSIAFDFRYTYWMVYAVLFGLIIVISEVWYTRPIVEKRQKRRL